MFNELGAKWRQRESESEKGERGEEPNILDIKFNISH